MEKKLYFFSSGSLDILIKMLNNGRYFKDFTAVCKVILGKYWSNVESLTRGGGFLSYRQAVGVAGSRTWQPSSLATAQKNLLLSGKMASNVEAPERWYLALLGFAEHFRTSSPPKIRLCVHCLQAVFQFKPPQRIEARTHLQLGSVLYHHTKNSELARSHLEKAVRDARRRKERGWARVGTGSRPEAAAAGNCGYSYILFLLEKPELLRDLKCCIWYSLFSCEPVVSAFVFSLANHLSRCGD